MPMTSAPAYSPDRLASLQGLRGIAASLVVVFHSVQIWRELSGATGFIGFWDRGWAGVDLFFVISGFVMIWVVGDRTASVKTAGRFWFDRATRIFPLWWVFCTLMGLYFLIAYGQPASPVTYPDDTGWGVFAKSMLLWPQGNLPVLSVGWTLIYELAFYALFGLFLLMPDKWRPLGLALWGVILLGFWQFTAPNGGLPDSWLMTLLDPLCLEFLIGAAVAYSVRNTHLSRGMAVGVAAVGITAFVLFMIFAGGFDSVSLNRSRVLAFGLPSGVILLGVVGLELSGRKPKSGWLLSLGDASYTLYLSHFLVLLVLKRICASLGVFTDATALALIAFAVIGTIASVIVSLVLYQLIERPLLRLARAPLAKRAASRQN